MRWSYCIGENAIYRRTGSTHTCLVWARLLNQRSRDEQHALSADLAGVENIGSDFATFIRTVVVLISFLVLLLATGQFATPGPILPLTWTFLIVSGLGTGASWLCYFRALKLGPASMVAPIDKLSVVLVTLCPRIPGRASLSNRMARHRFDCSRRGDHRDQGLITAGSTTRPVSTRKLRKIQNKVADVALPPHERCRRGHATTQPFRADKLD
jgi:uncharacterized membrane protein